jgi:molecular chaperone DnaK (HSP70)
MGRRKVGVDFGYDRCRMASSKSNGDPSVVLNRAQERETPSAVARMNGECVRP